jgi:hypothetical protein
MWITTATLDLVAIRALNEVDATDLTTSIRSKKDELKAIDGAGESIAEYPNPDNYNDIPLDQTTLIVKRAWNHETNAQAFVDHLAGLSHVTAALEEQA